MRPGRLILALTLCANGAAANVPQTSLRPVARVVATPADAVPDLNIGVVIFSEGPGVVRSLRPELRPSIIRKVATAVAKARAKGQVCGVRDLQGEAIADIPGTLSGCGVDNPVRLRSVSGVALSTGAIMDCTTAKALKSWVDKGMKPAVGRRGGGVKSIRVVAHYSCRTRNSEPGAKVSEHGKGHAIDIAGFTLVDGSTLSVLNDWGSSKDGRILSKMHKSACGPFGTVLGPDADKFHRDHFHFDTARYRSGSYCR